MMDYILHTFFMVSGPRDAVTEQADRLMDALVESVDDDVYDPAISFDAEAGLTEVEVGVRGESRMDAEAAALARVAEVMREVGIPIRELSERRVVELVPA